MKLSIVTGVCGAVEVTKRWVHETIGNLSVNPGWHQAGIEAPEVVVVSNGNTHLENTQLHDMFSGWAEVVTFPDPVGSTKAFNAGVAAASGDIVAMLHNDLMVLDKGWDRRILEAFALYPQAGVMGFHGARLLGMPGIYATPYDFRQLARADCFSNMVNAEAHGRRISGAMEVVTLDGMALICRRPDFLRLGGFDERMIHHMYDHDLCLTFRKNGFMNIVLPISCDHVSGQTANHDRYGDWLRSRGIDGDNQVHADAHAYFYEKWRNRLPQSLVPQVADRE